jgi:hypothetical protein
MKSFIPLLALAAAFMLASCGIKGGTIEVTNGTSETIEVSVTKGATPGVPNTKITPKATEKWVFAEDGTYTVCVLHQLEPKTVILMGGRTEKVTINPEVIIP